ncbi:MAG: twin-arginine translocase TatA/TatE family subunit [Chloroflexi bacterium]|nr:twin-arginine translocase TatA/TatE family subunit [Chloroflexota bacterium]
MPGLGPWELIIILLIVVVIFGAGRLSEIGGALGRGIREFRSATKDEEEKAAAAAAAGGSTTVTTTVSPASAASTAPTAAPTTVPSAGDHRCASCGTVNPPSQVFCGQCGSKLTIAA